MREGFEVYGIDVKNKVTGSIKTFCPKCHEDRNNKHDKSLSVDIKEGIWNCHYCSWSGCLKDDSFKMKEKKAYTEPKVIQQVLSDKTKAWFQTRGIGHQALTTYAVTESNEWMPQVEKERNCINFNYFREGKLVNVKFRDGHKNFKMVSGAELIFYGMDLITDKETVIITEGEIDAISVYEATTTPALSVPNGASKGSMKLEYLDNCHTFFDGYKKIVLATDSDGAGIALRDELARRLGTDRCFFPDYPSDCKDINEVLLKYGKGKVREILVEVKSFPIPGIAEVSDFEDEIDDIFNNGYPKTEKIGCEFFDQLLSFRGGEVTTITGYPGSGKSEFVDFITMRLAELHNWRTGIFSAENPKNIHFTKLAERFIGKKVWDENKRFQMSKEELQKAKVFINDHYFFVKPADADITVEGLLEMASQLVKRKGIKAFIIDPWNCIEHKRPATMNETEYVSFVYGKFQAFAENTNLHLFVVAHPVKPQKDKKTGEYPVPTLYMINGSSHFYNKTFNGLSVYRDYQTNDIEVHVQKVKFKFVGKVGMVEFKYEWTNGRYSEKLELKMPEKIDQVPPPPEFKNNRDFYDRDNEVQPGEEPF